MRRGQLGGIVLVLLGLLFWWIEASGPHASIVPALVGAAFLAAWAWTGTYGFLIPGALATGAGLGVALEPRIGDGWLVVLGAGLGFLAIYALDALAEGTFFARRWPLVPGIVVTLVGIALGLEELAGFEGFRQLWPVAVIAIGVWLLLVPRFRKLG